MNEYRDHDKSFKEEAGGMGGGGGGKGGGGGGVTAGFEL